MILGPTKSIKISLLFCIFEASACAVYFGSWSKNFLILLGAAQLQPTDGMNHSWPTSIWQEISVWALYRFLVSLQEAEDEAESDNLMHTGGFMTIFWL